MARWLTSLKIRSFGDLRRDGVAGLVGAISSVPDGMASGVLAGVNPVYGLYASVAGPIAGGMSSSTKLMVITTTSAAALAAGSALADVDPSERAEALFLLTCIAGVIMIAAGLARLGRYTRFVSHSVMIGFLTGIAANIILGQLPDLSGASVQGSFPLSKALDLLAHPSRIDVASLACGIGAIVLVVGLSRTKLGAGAAVVALAAPTVIVSLLHWDSVPRVRDNGPIPTGIPLPHLPEFQLLSPALISGAIAVAALVLVQGAGVSESAPNPDRTPSDASRDFTAQGVANLAAGLLRGMPVGGSVGSTALNISSGAVTRWAAIFCGVWMLIILAAFSPLIAVVAMPTLAGLLIYAAVMSIRPGQIRAILRAGTIARISVVVTFIATLVLSVPAAVGVGVALSLLLQLNRDALDLRLVELEPTNDGLLRELHRPLELHDDAVVLVDVYGSLLYAGARTLGVRLPDPSSARHCVVVLRLRGRIALGATFFATIDAYSRQLADNHGHLFLSGVDPLLLEQHRHSFESATVTVVEASDLVGESSALAYHQGQRWLEGKDA